MKTVGRRRGRLKVLECAFDEEEGKLLREREGRVREEEEAIAEKEECEVRIRGEW